MVLYPTHYLPEVPHGCGWVKSAQGKGQLPLPGVPVHTVGSGASSSARVFEGPAVTLQPGLALLGAGSALKGSSLGVEGYHVPSSGLPRDWRQTGWLLPVIARCDCNRKTYVLEDILPVAIRSCRKHTGHG